MSGNEINVVGKLIQEKARIHKERPFLYFKDEVFTYEQLDKGSNQFAHAFRARGLKKDDKPKDDKPKDEK